MSKASQSRTVYVFNRTRAASLATAARVANGYWSRLIGLLGQTKRWARPGNGLWIVPSRGVHTIGMLFPIDLVFLNKAREVIHLEECVHPFRVSRVLLHARSVLELPSHTIRNSGTQVGDVLEIEGVSAESARPPATSVNAGSEGSQRL